VGFVRRLFFPPPPSAVDYAGIPPPCPCPFCYSFRSRTVPSFPLHPWFSGPICPSRDGLVLRFGFVTAEVSTVASLFALAWLFHHCPGWLLLFAGCRKRASTSVFRSHFSERAPFARCRSFLEVALFFPFFFSSPFLFCRKKDRSLRSPRRNLLLLLRLQAIWPN